MKLLYPFNPILWYNLTNLYNNSGVFLLKIQKKWQAVCLLSVILLFLSLFQNCTEYEPLSDSKNLRSVNCKVQSSAITPFEKNKVQINLPLSGGMQRNTKPGVQQKLTETKIELSLLVDLFCLSQEENPVTVLGQSIIIPDELSSLNRTAISLTFHGSIDMDQLTQDMNHPCLIGISENQTVTVGNIRSSSSSLDDPLVTDQDHLDFLNYRRSIPLQNQITAPVVVAVVDSGIDKNHVDLRNRLWDNGQGEPGRSFAENTNINDLWDNTNHGTHIAGIIAASQNDVGTAGLNHDFVQIMVVRIFRNEEATVSTMYNGIRYAIENGADVINLSFATNVSNSTIDQAVIEAVNAGIVVAMAVSNDSREISNSFCPSPACVAKDLNGGLSVGSVDTETGELSDFSNFSSTFVEMAAPGSELGKSKGLLSTIANNLWERKAGTSMSVPVVSAAAAFLIGYFKTNNIQYSAGSIENFLKENGSRESQTLQSKIQGGRIIDFGKITQNLDRSYTDYCL